VIRRPNRCDMGAEGSLSYCIRFAGPGWRIRRLTALVSASAKRASTPRHSLGRWLGAARYPGRRLRSLPSRTLALGYGVQRLRRKPRSPSHRAPERSRSAGRDSTLPSAASQPALYGSAATRWFWGAPLARSFVVEPGPNRRSSCHVSKRTEPLIYFTPKALHIVAQGK
jgi:hypothetical protein